MAAQIPLYQPSQLPPSSVGQVKPSLALADQSGKQQVGQVISGIGNEVWSNLLTAKVNNEKATFLGAEKTARANLNQYITDNPFASEGDIRDAQGRMIAEIEDAGQKSRLPDVKNYAKNWMAQNKEALFVNSGNDITQIIKQREQENFNLQSENLKKSNDSTSLDEWKTLIDNQSGVLIDPQNVEIMKKAATQYKTAQFEKMRLDQVTGGVEQQAFTMAATQGYPAVEEMLRDPATIAGLIESGVSRKDARSLLNDIEERVKSQQVQDEEALKVQRESDRGVVNDAIHTGQYKQEDGTMSTDIRALIESTSLDEDEQESKWQQSIKETDRKLRGINIVTNQQVRIQLNKDVMGILTHATTRDETLEKAHNARFGYYVDKDGEKQFIEPTLNETDYNAIVKSANAQYEQGYGQMMSKVDNFAEGILLKTDSLGYVKQAPVREKQLGDFQQAFSEWIASQGDQLKLSEIFPEGRRLAATFQMSDVEAGLRETEFNLEMGKIEAENRARARLPINATDEQIAMETEAMAANLPPLLTGDDVPEEYRKMGATSYRPSTQEDYDNIVGKKTNVKSIPLGKHDDVLKGELGILKRPGGGFSTEISVTVQLDDGDWVNIPSLVIGQTGIDDLLAGKKITYNQTDIAVKRALKREKAGGNLPRYSTLESALTEAKGRKVKDKDPYNRLTKKRKGTRKKLTTQIQVKYLQIADGDIEEAKRLAAEDGYKE